MEAEEETEKLVILVEQKRNLRSPNQSPNEVL